MDTTAKERVRAKLITKHPVEQVGIWLVKGEDSNADFGGHHYMPTLGYFEGRYLDVVDLAINLKSFFTWGGGGSIDLITVQKVERDTVRELEETMTELDALKKREKELTEKAKRLGNSR